MAHASIHPCKHSATLKKIIDQMESGDGPEMRPGAYVRQGVAMCGADGGAMVARRAWAAGVRAAWCLWAHAYVACFDGRAVVCVCLVCVLCVSCVCLVIVGEACCATDLSILLFLKFISSIIPTIEYDFTVNFDTGAARQ